MNRARNNISVQKMQQAEHYKAPTYPCKEPASAQNLRPVEQQTASPSWANTDVWWVVFASVGVAVPLFLLAVYLHSDEESYAFLMRKSPVLPTTTPQRRPSREHVSKKLQNKYFAMRSEKN